MYSLNNYICRREVKSIDAWCNWCVFLYARVAQCAVSQWTGALLYARLVRKDVTLDWSIWAVMVSLFILRMLYESILCIIEIFFNEKFRRKWIFLDFGQSVSAYVYQIQYLM